LGALGLGGAETCFAAAELNIRGIIGKRGGRFYASTIRAICINDLHSDIKAAA
jgi:hypothetical protein